MGHLRLTGFAGYLAGEVREILPGETIVVGRSRSCGFSLRKSAKWKAEGKSEAQADPAFRAVSRKHARIAVLPEGKVEIEGLGANGTFVDGIRIDKILLTDLARKSHELKMGPQEKLRLEWIHEA